MNVYRNTPDYIPDYFPAIGAEFEDIADHIYTTRTARRLTRTSKMMLFSMKQSADNFSGRIKISVQIQIFNDIFCVICLFAPYQNLNSKFEFSNCHFFFRQVHDLVSTFPNGFGTKRRRSLTVTLVRTLLLLI